MEGKTEDKALLHNFKDTPNLFTGVTIVVFLVILLGGVGAGYLFSKTNNGSVALTSKAETTSGSSPVKGAVYGSNDLSTFKDSATGVMTAGGVDGEGQFHLVRPGGDSQNVYLTSSLVDLGQFIGKKVKVYGQTQAAKKAGWLMDVGRVEVLE